ncbi:chaperonin 10-like protein [Aspergillus pseudotamarii]|uniref:Chaperonin 10-like protein n=1 Tax=Aspergillus pseudotamarii TaxID=132259 RepID=A0A5N6SNG7_ASPPS|nr:chaperonin 10-like protein [Aspergillus pseudotamarii]KAE8135251.1 chaperonin 10-like protein [Aspergillus pseudotamarii]
MSTMRAVVAHTAGPPDVLKVIQYPLPQPTSGQVRIKVKAFGLNRSEMYTRQGHSGSAVQFPRIFGIEAVGIVDAAPGLEDKFPLGATVATAMGGMGRAFDGGYAEYTCVPAKQVQILKTKLPWDVLGALPEMLQTAWGSLIRSLTLRPKDRLLIRGGTSSVGLAAAAIAKKHGAFVASTTRKKEREALLRDYGVDEVWIDNGAISQQIAETSGQYFDKVLELVGTATLADSLRCVKKGGIVSMTGILGNEWHLEKINPMELIPSESKLTAYSGGNEEFMRTPLKELVKMVEEGKLQVRVGRVFKMEDIAEAHRCMEESEIEGKIVVIP